MVKKVGKTQFKFTGAVRTHREGSPVISLGRRGGNGHMGSSGGMNRSFTDRLSGWVAPWGPRRVLFASSNTAVST